MEDNKNVEVIVSDEVKNSDLELNIIGKIDEIIKALIKSDKINEELTKINFDGTILHGNAQERQKMFADYVKYSGEVQNPKNTKFNPFHKSNYAPLDEVLNVVKPVMSKYGLSMIQIPSSRKDGFIIVDTILIHKDGAFMTIEGIAIRPDKPTAQGIGSTITYGRRYGVSAISGVSSEEDDDGNSASGLKTNNNVSAGKIIPTKPTQTQAPNPPKVNTPKVNPPKVDTPKVDVPEVTTEPSSGEKVLALKQLKSKINEIAKEKFAEVGQSIVMDLISETLSGKKVKDSEESDRPLLQDLLTKISELKS